MKKYLICALIFVGIFLSAFPARAEDVQGLEKKIEELERKVSELKTQAQTLAGQVAYYDGQIALNQLKITQTGELINSITGKIESLEKSLQNRAVLLQKQIVATYKHSYQDPIRIIFSSPDFSKLVTNFKYTQVIQNSSRQLMHDTQIIQSNYASQKTLIEESKVRLEAQKRTLANLQAEKKNLLVQTKNNEATYQLQLRQAKLELEAIQRALIAGKKEGPVKTGDPIALTGNSGYPSCSTGKHLHFEVQVNGQWVNAETYLKNITDKWGMNIGSGSWDWPLRGEIQITQRYGVTPYSYRYYYSGGVHTGIDMVSTDDIIRAPADGTLYPYTGSCGPSSLNIKYIEHGSGLVTLYLHVQ